MSYLIVETAAAAQQRSAQAWEALGNSPGATLCLWAWRQHPTTALAALVIPPTPERAQVSVTPAVYDALLTAEERAAPCDALPDGWEAADA